MKRFLQFTGIIFWFLFLGWGILYLKANSRAFNEFLRYIGLLSLLLGVSYLAVRIIWGDGWLVRGTKAFIFGNDLIKALKQFQSELPKPSPEATSVLAGHLIYRFSRAGIIAFLGVLLPTILLWNQNTLFGEQNKFIKAQTDLMISQDTLIKRQNQLFRDQNDEVLAQKLLMVSQDSLIREQNAYISDQTNLFNRQILQTDMEISLLERQDSSAKEQVSLSKIEIQLSEADRRSSLNFLMGGLFEQITAELSSDPKERNLEDETISRIVGLSQSFKPYRYLQSGILNNHELSPERGNLFVTLANMGFADKTLNKIFRKGNFKMSDFTGSRLNDFSIEHINLAYSDFSRSDLSLSTFNSSIFLSSKITDVIWNNFTSRKGSWIGLELSDVIWIKSDFQDAVFSESNIWNIQILDSNFKRTNFSSTTIGTKPSTRFHFKTFVGTLISVPPEIVNRISKSDFSNVDFGNAKIQNLEILNCDFRGMKALNYSDRSTHISHSLFSSSRMSEAQLQYVTFDSCKFYRDTFDHTKMLHVQFNVATMDSLSFADAILSSVDFVSISSSQFLDFSGATLNKVHFKQGNFASLSFNHAMISNISFENIEIGFVDFTDAIVNNIVFKNISDEYRQLIKRALGSAKEISGIKFL